MEISNEILLYLIVVLSFSVFILLILVGILFSKAKAQKRRYDTFMGTKKRPEYSLEYKLDSYFKSVKDIESHYKKLLFLVEDIDLEYKKNIQKVGLIKYNPFAEMGGNLCFALALLDGEDNGVVINGIHSRTGSFTYAKPVEHGVSMYLLSEEELQAIEKARETAHKPQVERSVKVKFKPSFRKKVVKPVKSNSNQQQQNKTTEKHNNVKEGNYEATEKHNEDMLHNVSNDDDIPNSNNINGRNKIKNIKVEPKRSANAGVGGKRYSVGDVTEEEKNRILEDEQEAMKIAKAYEPKSNSKNVKERIKNATGVKVVDNFKEKSDAVKTAKPKRFNESQDE